MIIIGERINATRKPIKEALLAMDAEFIKKEAKDQEAAGADYLDVNGGLSPAEEMRLMLWLTGIVQEVSNLPLCIDSPSPAVIRAGLKACKNGRPLVNSISMEKGRYEEILPLVKEHNAMVVALAMDDSGIPRTAADRLKVIERLVKEAEKAGVKLEDVYVDPLVMALSADSGAGVMVMDVLAGMKKNWPGLKSTCGLSNISFGLPNRRLLNRVYLSMLIAHGLESAIVDPLDSALMAQVFAARALYGRDEYCMNYIGAFRAKKLEV